MTADQIEACAQAAHELNRVWCSAHGDFSQATWADAPQWQKDSAINGVKGVLAGNTPEQSHESWLAEKQATGWVYGAVKDATKKTHPCMVPYSDLPRQQKAKDMLFVGVVRLLVSAYQWTAEAY